MKELNEYKNLIINRLNEVTNNWQDKEILKDSINYSLLNYGKLIRSTMFLIALDDLDIDYNEYVDIAAALEMIQTYTLIHDDLPIMDNAQVRRNKKTNHLVYSPGIAMLAGDALLSDAFKIIANANINTEIKIKIIAKISEKIGSSGICYGQTLDLQNEKIPFKSKEEVLKIIEYKTSSFFMLIYEIVGIITNNANIEKLKRLGLLIGYTFQIKDDLNDALNTSIGKDNGIDVNKSTINKIVGIDNTKLMCDEYLKEINSLINEIFSNKTLLKYINITL